MSETIVRSSPYRRSDCITIVCLLELKSAAQRYLFDCSLSCAAHPCEAARGNYVWPRPLGGGGKNLGCCRSHGYSAYFVQSVRTHTPPSGLNANTTQSRILEIDSDESIACCSRDLYEPRHVVAQRGIMEELFLIAHKVRGEVAFDVAQRLTLGCGRGVWLIPTSGHQAWPLRWMRLDESLAVGAEELAGVPDHYPPKQSLLARVLARVRRPSQRKGRSVVDAMDHLLERSLGEG